MWRLVFAGCLAVTAFAETRQLTISPAEDQSVVTTISSTLALNAGSTLTRRRFVVNDDTSPVDMGKLSISTRLTPRGYTFVIDGRAFAKSEIRAVSFIFALFDVWGEPMKRLVMTRLADIQKGERVPVSDGAWQATEDEAVRYRTCVAFADKVLMADGSIWRADRGAVARKLNDIEVSINLGLLESMTVELKQ